jgi:hypothetical protein
MPFAAWDFSPCAEASGAAAMTIANNKALISSP